MARIVSLASMLGRLHPAIFDAIFPHGPVLSHAARGGLGARDARELRSAPLPPNDELLLASAEVSRDIAFAALGAEASGNPGAVRIITTAVDDWCGTGRPGVPIPWPGPWPIPRMLETHARQEWDVAGSRVVGALSLAAVAGRLSKGPVRDALSNGAERLLEVALG